MKISLILIILMNRQDILLKIIEKEFLLVFSNGQLILSRKGQNPMAMNLSLDFLLFCG